MKRKSEIAIQQIWRKQFNLYHRMLQCPGSRQGKHRTILNLEMVAPLLSKRLLQQPKFIGNIKKCCVRNQNR